MSNILLAYRRAATLVPVTLVSRYLAFRAGDARPTASVVHQKVA